MTPEPVNQKTGRCPTCNWGLPHHRPDCPDAVAAKEPPVAPVPPEAPPGHTPAGRPTREEWYAQAADFCGGPGAHHNYQFPAHWPVYDQGPGYPPYGAGGRWGHQWHPGWGAHALPYMFYPPPDDMDGGLEVLDALLPSFIRWAMAVGPEHRDRLRRRAVAMVETSRAVLGILEEDPRERLHPDETERSRWRIGRGDYYESTDGRARLVPADPSKLGQPTVYAIQWTGGGSVQHLETIHDHPCAVMRLAREKYLEAPPQADT